MLLSVYVAEPQVGLSSTVNAKATFVITCKSVAEADTMALLDSAVLSTNTWAYVRGTTVQNAKRDKV